MTKGRRALLKGLSIDHLEQTALRLRRSIFLSRQQAEELAYVNRLIAKKEKANAAAAQGH